MTHLSFEGKTATHRHYD